MRALQREKPHTIVKIVSGDCEKNLVCRCSPVDNFRVDGNIQQRDAGAQLASNP